MSVGVAVPRHAFRPQYTPQLRCTDNHTATHNRPRAGSHTCLALCESYAAVRLVPFYAAKSIQPHTTQYTHSINGNNFGIHSIFTENWLWTIKLYCRLVPFVWRCATTGKHPQHASQQKRSKPENRPKEKRRHKMKRNKLTKRWRNNTIWVRDENRKINDNKSALHLVSTYSSHAEREVTHLLFFPFQTVHAMAWQRSTAAGCMEAKNRPGENTKIECWVSINRNNWFRESTKRNTQMRCKDENVISVQMTLSSTQRLNNL